jgi:hypothetical protein
VHTGNLVRPICSLTIRRVSNQRFASTDMGLIVRGSNFGDSCYLQKSSTSQTAKVRVQQMADPIGLETQHRRADP